MIFSSAFRAGSIDRLRSLKPTPTKICRKIKPFMTKQYKDRLKILEDHEIDELYGLPRFDPDEQSYYFSLTQEERSCQ
jgi:hypothetical protein